MPLKRLRCIRNFAIDLTKKEDFLVCFPFAVINADIMYNI